VDPVELELFLDDLKTFFLDRNMELRIPRFYGSGAEPPQALAGRLLLWRVRTG